MIKLFKMKLIMTFVVMVIVGNISTTVLPVFHKESNTVKKTQTSNVKNTKIDSKTINENNTANKESLNEELEENEKEKQQEPTYSKVEEQNKTNYIKKETYTDLKTEESNNKTDTKEKENIKLNDTSSDENNQDDINITETKIPTIDYDRTTSIYANDNITLLRIEYYKNNKLTYYSVVEQFDADTKSYIEKIYQCNRETNIDPLIRTDVYNNGNLIKTY